MCTIWNNKTWLKHRLHSLCLYFLERNTSHVMWQLSFMRFVVFNQFCMNLITNLTFGKLIVDFLFSLLAKLRTEEQNWAYETGLRNSWKHHSGLYSVQCSVPFHREWKEIWVLAYVIFCMKTYHNPWCISVAGVVGNSILSSLPYSSVFDYIQFSTL